MPIIEILSNSGGGKIFGCWIRCSVLSAMMNLLRCVYVSGVCDDLELQMMS